MSLFHQRQSYMAYGELYFYTLTIEKFAHLLQDDHLKFIIVKSLQFLTENKRIEVYGYVIMPNHIHLLWSMLSANGKESPAGSFC